MYLFCETDYLAQAFIMINQYHLMSHITMHECKIDRFELGTTSKYISSYIQQRKALILAKLARNSNPLNRDMDEVIELTKSTHKQQVCKGSFKLQGKTHTIRKTSEISAFQKSNKNNKNDYFQRQTDPNKFLTRSSMYQKQKQLSFQFQKRKNLFTQASTHKFQPNLPKKEEITQSKITEKKAQKQQETYQQKHEKKHSKNWDDQRVNYKDLMKQSMTKYNQNKQNSTTTKDQKERWKQIEEIFEKVKVNIPTYEHPLKVEENHNTRDDYEKDATEDYIHHLEVNQVKLSMKKVESDEQNIKDFVQKLEIQQHFEEDLSGIMMDDDLKEQVDSSHVFQRVVNEMMLESEEIKSEIAEQKLVDEAQIIQSISILHSNPDNKEQQDAGTHQYHQVINVAEDEWIKDEEKEDFSEEHIVIQKVQSQIIENSQVQSKIQSVKLVQSKVEIMEGQPSLQEEDNSVSESLIDQLSQEIIREVQKQQIIIENPQRQCNLRQKQSLETLANQFMMVNTKTKPSDDEEDFDIPDEEQPNINIQIFDFSTVSHQFTANTISNTMPLPDFVDVDQMQPSIIVNDLSHQQNEETTEQIDDQEDMLHEQPRINNIVRSLINFGEFLVIPEESDEESRQSIG